MREANVSIDNSAFEAMGIEPLIDLGREAGIREFEELACHGTSAVVQMTVESRYDEEQLDGLDCVDQWDYVAETETGHLYVIAFTAPDLPESLTETSADLVGTCDPELDERSATMSLVGPQETISDTISEYEAAGVAPQLRKLGSYEGDDHPLDALTDRQREVIETAFEMGYYEVPREISTEEIASELELDPSTVVEHLQRAERNVFSQLL
ncbi:helix-turn-helix domain-containing protein [Halovenus marina]|uniref:helix-turn-helix domain-containing protein n=1 Tax=Halovenus marina TaxID=3396621 RepID=UPI003F564D65